MPRLPALTVAVRVAVAATSLAACAARGAPAAQIPRAGGDDAPPFDPAAVQARLAATPQNAECNGFDEGTLGVLMAEQRSTAVEAGAAIDESFACAPLDETRWECTWAMVARPRDMSRADASCAAGACGYQIVVDVDRTGAFADDDIACLVPD